MKRGIVVSLCFARPQPAALCRRALLTGAVLVVGAGLIVVPTGERAAADFQQLPATSPTTWSYAATLKIANTTAAATAKTSASATAASNAAAQAYSSAKRALASAQAKLAAATQTQARAKTAYTSAKSTDDKAKAKAAYNRAIGARYAAIDDVKQKTTAVNDKNEAAKAAKKTADTAAVVAAAAAERVARLKVLYGSSPDTAFTKPRKTYTFPGDRHRPDQNVWSIYSNAGTKYPQARDSRYIGVYKNNLEVTSWGPYGAGVCLCKPGHLPTTPYGRWEVRAKVNSNTGHGVAILLWPNERTGPESGEIDLGEFNHERTQANFALHYDAKNLQVQSHVLGDFTKWHTYRVDWNSRGVAWYLDNNLFAIVTDKVAIPTKPFRLVLQAGPSSPRAAKTSTTLTVSSVKTFAP